MTSEETDTERRSMADVSHTNPYTGETAGRLFNRGPTVATDGGTENTRRAATDPSGGTESEPTDTMADVDHTPPRDADDANRVFERGREPTTTVEDAE